MSAFEIGRNLAVTPGKVVFQNDLIQLIQYAPTTEEVYERPLLDRAAMDQQVLHSRSRAAEVVRQMGGGAGLHGIPGLLGQSRHQARAEDLRGLHARRHARRHRGGIRQTGSPKINALGYCVGGTLLASALAYMAAKDDNRIASASFLAAQVDFSKAGDLLVFIDDAQLNSLEEMMAEHGYLDGSRMAAVFNMLGPKDLIWPYIINNYLLGKKPFPFDLLFWNAELDADAAGQSHLLSARVLSLEQARQGRDATRRRAARSLAR